MCPKTKYQKDNVNVIDIIKIFSPHGKGNQQEHNPVPDVNAKSRCKSDAYGPLKARAGSERQGSSKGRWNKIKGLC